MALTGKIVPYKKGFGPFTPQIYHAPFPAEYLGITAADSLTALEQLFSSEIEPDCVAAIIIEPVQGEGGFYPVPKGFMAELRAVCDQHGILLIVDEVQTGFARTGRMFAMEYEETEADIMTLAKGIAGGFALAAVVGKKAVMDAPDPGGLGGTFAGSPLASVSSYSIVKSSRTAWLPLSSSRSRVKEGSILFQKDSWLSCVPCATSTESC